MVTGKRSYSQSKEIVQRPSETSMACSTIIKEQLWLEPSERKEKNNEQFKETATGQ